MEISVQYKVKKNHAFLKQGTLIYLMPVVYEYFVKDDFNLFIISQSDIFNWLENKSIKLYYK